MIAVVVVGCCWLLLFWASFIFGGGGGVFALFVFVHVTADKGCLVCLHMSYPPIEVIVIALESLRCLCPYSVQHFSVSVNKSQYHRHRKNKIIWKMP